MPWTLWTIRAALLCYVLSIALRRSVRFATWRLLWSTAWLLCVIHVALAFHLVHEWSHAQAVAQTAADTRAVTGVDWGGGIWFNYALLAAWGVDVGWSWCSPSSYRTRGCWIDRGMHAFLAFMAVSATILFEDGAIRWAGVTALLLLAFQARRCHTAPSKTPANIPRRKDSLDEERGQGRPQER